MNITNNALTNNPYRSPLPYPPIQVQGPNLCYANLLMDDYAGSASELSALSQYLYHNLTESGYTDIAATFLGIAEVEMTHLHMLGETIVLLGCDPVFSSGCPCSFWSGKNVTYGYALCDKINDDLNGELGAIRQYERHICQIGDPYVKEILARIVLDEKVHVDLLHEAFVKYCGGRCCPT